MKVLASVLVSVLMICVSPSSSAEEGEKILITAKPVSTRFIKFDESHLVSPSYYELKIRDIKVIQGADWKFPKQIKTEIRANHGEIIPKYDRIFLLLEVKGDDITVIAWEQVVSMACIPVGVIDPRYRDYYFENYWGNTETQCTFIKGRIPLPVKP